jgi:hypothetical protein
MTTIFTRETTSQGIKEEPNLSMMSPEAEKMASHSAPLNAFSTTPSQAEGGTGLDKALHAGKPTGRKP